MTNTLDILARVVDEAECAKPGWSFRLDKDDETGGTVMVIRLDTVNNYDPTKRFVVDHYSPVPLTTYNEATWRRWVFDRCVAVMVHELGESISFDGIRPFEPTHGPGEDPYVVHEHRPDVDFMTRQDGSMR